MDVPCALQLSARPLAAGESCNMTICPDKVRTSSAPCVHYLKPDIAAHPGFCGVPGTTRFFCTEAMRAKRWPFTDNVATRKEVNTMSKFLRKEDVSQTGRFVLLYGPTGVGKTTTILQTALEPILYIQTEPRSLKPSLDAAGRPNLDIDIYEYKDWGGLMDLVRDSVSLDSYATITVDSYSHLISICLSSEIEAQAFDARSEKEKDVKALFGQVKLTQEGYGVLASQMLRLTSALGKLSREGHVVLVTCLLQENPKWNRNLAAGPALKGKEFPVNMPGFFDLIGLVETRQDSDGNILYPPMVRFQSSDDSFIAKWTGTGKRTSGPLNITKILNL